MFLGHFGLGFGAKRPAPRTSLGTMFFAAQFLDLLWPLLVLVGIEHVEIRPGITEVNALDFVSYPISHSLLMAIVWATVFAFVYSLRTNYLRGARWLWLLVVSHWVLDVVVHRPDLPLYPGSSIEFGLGMWNSLAGSIVVEGVLFTLGVIVYVRTTAPQNRTGTYALLGLILFLIATYIASVLSAPPSTTAVATSALSMWLLVAWGYWIDRNRTVVANQSAPPTAS
jgi:hypothetical protein